MKGTYIPDTYYIDVIRHNKTWYWRLKRRNGKILGHSETYKTKQACYKTVRLLERGLERESDVIIKEMKY